MTSAMPHTRLIAIVEDDDTMATTYQHILEEEGGWRTLVMGDGAEALRQLPQAHPDLILLDLALPGLDGISLYRMLRVRPETAATPILIVTASEAWKLRREGIETHEYLRKPFALDTLLAAIAALLAGAGQQAPDKEPAKE